MNSYVFLRGGVSTIQAPHDSMDGMFAGDDIAVVLHLTVHVRQGCDPDVLDHRIRTWFCGQIQIQILVRGEGLRVSASVG